MTVLQLFFQLVIEINTDSSSLCFLFLSLCECTPQLYPLPALWSRSCFPLCISPTVLEKQGVHLPPLSIINQSLLCSLPLPPSVPVHSCTLDVSPSTKQLTEHFHFIVRTSTPALITYFSSKLVCLCVFVSYCVCSESLNHSSLCLLFLDSQMSIVGGNMHKLPKRYYWTCSWCMQSSYGVMVVLQFMNE